MLTPAVYSTYAGPPGYRGMFPALPARKRVELEIPGQSPIITSERSLTRKYRYNAKTVVRLESRRIWINRLEAGDHSGMQGLELREAQEWQSATSRRR